MTNTKLRRLLWLATALAVLVLSAAGCSGGDSAASSAPTDSYAQSLYNSRVQYIGDNAAVGSLLSQLGVDNRMGAFTMELQTKDKPYGLTLHFEQAPEDATAFSDQFQYYGNLLLALIDNCGQVSCTYPTSESSASHTMTWTAEDAHTSLDTDVKACGGSAEGVAALLDTIRTVYRDNPNIQAVYQDT